MFKLAVNFLLYVNTLHDETQNTLEKMYNSVRKHTEKVTVEEVYKIIKSRVDKEGCSHISKRLESEKFLEIFPNMKNHVFHHSLVYLKNDELYILDYDEDGLHKGTYTLREWLHKVPVVRVSDIPSKVENIIQRIPKVFEKGEYIFLQRNCEHFVENVLCNRHYSYQAYILQNCLHTKNLPYCRSFEEYIIT